MKRLGLSICATLLTIVSAQAADLGWNTSPSPIYSPSPAADWSGFYAGVNGGYAFGAVEREVGGVETDNDAGGWLLGGQAGYNMDMGGFIVGAEADLQLTNFGYSEVIPGVGSFQSGMDYFGTVRGRAGIGVGAVMPYITAGFAAGRGTSSLTDDLGVSTSQSATHLGWTVGAGLEAKATDNITFKAEYLYVDLGTQSYNTPPAGGSSDVFQGFSVVRAGLNYKF
jgi:outer membrane immunogenic protein